MFAFIRRSKQNVRNGQTRPIWQSTTQLSAISICDTPLKDSYLIRTAVEALNRCDVEQKIHLKGTLVGINLDVI